ncbi:MAG: gliding motility lipoprotein GldH [Flavobacteriaceae bacterium]|nr:gliding motility lipoprotein GldH [Flavobacteriaceae bacterium]
MRNFLVLLVAIISLTACDSKHVFDEYKTIPNTWNRDAIIDFNFKAPDTIAAYDLFINVRNNNSYEFSNLFLIVKITSPNNNKVIDTLEYEMTTPRGEWLGTGFSEIKENKLWYKEQFHFKEEGEYNVNITHAIRKNGATKGVSELKGITEVGFRIEKNTNEKKAL